MQRETMLQEPAPEIGFLVSLISRGSDDEYKKFKFWLWRPIFATGNWNMVVHGAVARTERFVTDVMRFRKLVILTGVPLFIFNPFRWISLINSLPISRFIRIALLYLIRLYQTSAVVSARSVSEQCNLLNMGLVVNQVQAVCTTSTRRISVGIKMTMCPFWYFW